MAGTQREITMRFLAEPGDVNFGGKVHGGAVMKWIDQAGYACAAGWSGRYCVTAYVGGIKFERPVAIGDLVEVRARVLMTGSSSMHIGVEVSARDPRLDAALRTTHCIMVFVAMDDARKPVAVPPFEPQTDEERDLAGYTKRIMELRASVEAERERFLSRRPG
jgi:acyl-CoA hydrolase